MREEEGAYRREDRPEGLRLSLEFHTQLGALCGNEVLARYLNELVLQTSLAVALYEQPDRVHAHADHGALFDAIAGRDARRAARLMSEHLEELEGGLRLGTIPQVPSFESIFGPAAREKQKGPLAGPR